MTTQESFAIVAQLDLVPKRIHYEAHNPRVDDKGRGVVEIVTEASPGTIMRWFDMVGAWVGKIENLRTVKGQLVTFDWK